MEIDDDYKTAIHYQPNYKNANVACLNGSAHVKKTLKKEEVNCEKCLDAMKEQTPFKMYIQKLSKELSSFT
jgi:hypothetical protein